MVDYGYQDNYQESMKSEEDDESEGMQQMNQSISAPNSAESFQGGSRLFEIFIQGPQQGKKVVNRVCCCRIQNQWTIMNQLCFSLLILSLFVLVLTVGIIFGNVLLTKYLVNKSSSDALNTQLENNVTTSSELYSINIMNYFQNLSNQLYKTTSAAKSYLGQNEDQFDYTNFKFPLHGKEIHKKMDWSPDSSNQNNQNSVNTGNEQLLRINYPESIQQELYFNYYSYAINSEQQQGEEEEEEEEENQQVGGTQNVLNAINASSYFFLYDFYSLFYINVLELFFYFPNQELVISYPFGLRKDNGQFLLTQSWKNDSELYYLKNKENSNELKKYLISEPYFDPVLQQKTITLTILILNHKNELIGIAGLNISSQKIQEKLDYIPLIENGQSNILVNEEGTIYTAPYYEKYSGEEVNNMGKIFDIKEFGLSSSNWTEIINSSLKQQKLITNTHNKELIIWLNNINITDKRLIFLTIIFHDKAFDILDSIEEKINELFVTWQYWTIGAVSGMCFVIMGISCCYLKKKLTPFQKLTEKAKYLGGNIETMKGNQDRDNKSMQQLDNLKGECIIGALIDKYQGLRKGRQRKKGQRSDENSELDVNYPDKNQYKQGQMEWSTQGLENYDFKQDKYQLLELLQKSNKEVSIEELQRELLDRYLPRSKMEGLFK